MGLNVALANGALSQNAILILLINPYYIIDIYNIPLSRLSVSESECQPCAWRQYKAGVSYVVYRLLFICFLLEQ